MNEPVRPARTVCLVGHSARMQGAERSMLELAEALTASGWRCTVLLPEGGPLRDAFLARGIDCRRLPYTWWMGPRSSLLRSVVKTIINGVVAVPAALLLKAWKCDLVYSNTGVVCVGAWAAALCRLPHVWHLREFGLEDHGLSYDLGERVAFGFVERLSDVCVVTSEALAAKFAVRLPRARMRVVPQAVRPGTASDAPREAPFRFAVLGAVNAMKGQLEAIEALGLVIRGGRAAELWIAGSGHPDYIAELRRVADANGVAAFVRFLGVVADPYTVLDLTHATLVCSRAEAFGRVAVESMFAGRPVVGARSGGTPELISHEENGLLYRPGDAADLADRMARLIDDPAWAAMLGRRGRSRAERDFTPGTYRARVAAVAEEALHARRGARGTAAVMRAG